MSEAVRVSVVIPVRDLSGDVASVVRSVLSSGLADVEVIVVEDGVPHVAGQILAPGGDARVVVVPLRASTGLARSLNVGIARARAPYVALLSPHDVIRPERLASALAALERNPQAGFVFADFERIDASGKVLQKSAMAPFTALHALPRQPLAGGWYLIAGADLARGLLSGNFISLSTVVLRRELLTELGPFDELSASGAELDLWFRLAHRSDALYCDQVGHSQHANGSDPSQPMDARRAREYITVLQRERERWKDRASRGPLNQRIAQCYAEIGEAERRRQRRLRSVAMFVAALATFPQGRWLRCLLRSIL